MNSTVPLLNYRLFQAEDGDNNQHETPFIILHGLLGAQDNWRSQAKRLSQFRPVYTLDLRNHGQSPHIKGMSYREMYDDVIRVANHLSLEEFHLLGHSMGGKVAMQLALAHPEIVKSLIIVDIAPKPYPLWHQKTLSAIMSAPIETMQSRQEIDDHLKTSIEDETERRFMLKNIKRKKNTSGKLACFEWRVNLEEISRGYLKIASFNSALEQYTKKSLFIAGALSQYIQESDTPLIHSLFPKAEVITLESSGHLPHFQQADDFFNVVQQFLT